MTGHVFIKKAPAAAWRGTGLMTVWASAGSCHIFSQATGHCIYLCPFSIEPDLLLERSHAEVLTSHTHIGQQPHLNWPARCKTSTWAWRPKAGFLEALR